MNHCIATINLDQFYDADIVDAMIEACAKFGLTIVSKAFYTFKPVGFTAVLLLAESHFAVHTWPEKKMMKVDLFTCGDHKPDLIIRHFAHLLNARECKEITIVREVF